MTGEAAHLAFEADGRDPIALAQHSAVLWAELAFDQDAHAILRRNGLDPTALRLSGPHPFSEAQPGGGIAVTAHAANRPSVETLLDLFRIYFRRRLTG